MTIRVYFMRHGDAGDKRLWKGTDPERPLSDLGVERTRAAAQHFARTQFRPTKIITSPYARALQTADIVAEVLGIHECVEVDERLAPGFDIRVFRRILKENLGEERLLLVGHDPSFSAVIEEVMGGGSIILKKGGVARVDIEDLTPPRGRLAWLDSPTLFARWAPEETGEDEAADNAEDPE
jgi:phosphohistidine phosphatase